MTAPDKKWFSAPIEIKDADKGTVAAMFAKIGVVDHDRDVVRPGAIQPGSDVLMSKYGHSIVTDGGLPVGDGTVVIEGDEAVFKGQMWLEMQDARDSYAVLKRRGSRQAWSFGYIVVDSEPPTEAEKKAGALRALTKLDTFEVSPVFRGAGIDTRTLAVKSAAQADGADDEAAQAAAADRVTAETKAAAAAAEAKALADAEEAADLMRRANEEFARFNRNFSP